MGDFVSFPCRPLFAIQIWQPERPRSGRLNWRAICCWYAQYLCTSRALNEAWVQEDATAKPGLGCETRPWVAQRSVSDVRDRKRCSEKPSSLPNSYLKGERLACFSKSSRCRQSLQFVAQISSSTFGPILFREAGQQLLTYVSPPSISNKQWIFYSALGHRICKKEPN